MTAHLDPYTNHYQRMDALVDALAAFNDVAEHLNPYDRDKVLEFFLPGVTRLADCWTELGEPLEQYARMDCVEAVSIMQERGHRFPNGPDAERDVKEELRTEIALVISQYRRPVVAHRTTLQAVGA